MVSPHTSARRHPFTSLLLLLLIIAICYFVFGVIAVFLTVFFYGGSLTGLSFEQMSPDAIRMIQGIVAAGAFVVPPLILSWSEQHYKNNYFGRIRNPNVSLIVLTVVILFVFSPFAEWINRVNQVMNFPESLKWIENWMRMKEDGLAELTSKLLVMHSFPDLLINLLVIAIIPAVGEELLFRGSLQSILVRWSGNYHLAVWVSAIIFSAIHVQFFGFLPRMLLGVLFGYIFVWSGSIVFPVLGHFVNNGMAVAAAYFLQKNGRSLDDLDNMQSSSIYAVIASFVFTLLLMLVFRTLSERIKLNNDENE